MIFDLHNDFPTVLQPSAFKDYVDKARRNALVIAALWTTSWGDDAYDNVVKLGAELAKTRGLARRAIAIEDIGFLSERDKYKTFDYSPYFYCSLTWNDDNAFAGGAMSDGSLSIKGRDAIKRINGSGCYLDVAHLNRKSFFAAAECAEKLICSHTGFNSHARSLNGDQIKLLIEKHAVIGLCAVPAFTDALNGERWAETIDAFAQKYGVDNLAVGTDFFGSADIPPDMDTYEKIGAVGYRLTKFGYSDRDIGKIFYDNAYDVFQNR